MRRAVALVVLVVLSVGTAGGAGAAGPDPVVVFDAQRARVHAQGAGGPLLRGDGRSALEVTRAFLAAEGRDAATVASLEVASEFTLRGVTHLRLRQQVGGARVAGAYARSAVDARGDLIHVIDNLVGVRAPARGLATAEQALAAAMARVHPGVADRPAVAERRGKVTTFRRTPFFQAAPRAEVVLVARQSGALEEGFLVETWSADENLLNHSVVDRGGQVVDVELRTANDSYNVFPEDPGKGGQQLVSGPGAGNAESPSGWLSGAQTTTNIGGNNVRAYLDTDANNAPDGGGTAVADGNFGAIWDGSVAPNAADNQAVAVQNLFYLNNVLHDTLYRHGFTEAAGNFQEDNFGNGGLGSDSVNAEAQDGSGTDNANFATPSDGSNPRMQMFLWTGSGPTHEVFVNGISYDARDAVFGPQLTSTGVTGPIGIVNDGVSAPDGGTPTDGCERLPRRSQQGKVALVDRGLCTFVTKVKNAQAAGAIGVIVANNVPGEPFEMGGSGKVRIPSVMVSQADGATLRGLAGDSATMRLLAAQPLQVDSSLDSDVVYHEYGHGLTWRMIGSMSGPLSGGVGEGASDTLAFLLNGDDRIGEYSSSDPLGIRRFPYVNYPNTYADWAGASVHNDGEIYAAAMWRLSENFAGAGLDNDDVLATWVDGMNFTLAGPAPEDMRDGMLASPASTGDQDCLIWDAFADFGIGVGADGAVVGNGVQITESFTVPGGCTRVP